MSTTVHKTRIFVSEQCPLLCTALIWCPSKLPALVACVLYWHSWLPQRTISSQQFQFWQHIAIVKITNHLHPWPEMAMSNTSQGWTRHWGFLHVLSLCRQIHTDQGWRWRSRVRPVRFWPDHMFAIPVLRRLLLIWVWNCCLRDVVHQIKPFSQLTCSFRIESNTVMETTKQWQWSMKVLQSPTARTTPKYFAPPLLTQHYRILSQLKSWIC